MLDGRVRALSSIEHLASSIEPHLVKPLHPLADIAACISQADGDGASLTHVVGGEPISTTAGQRISINPVTSVQDALSEPLDYPPLAAGIVPGDRVAIAVDDAVPCLADIVRGTVAALKHAGVEPRDISIVTANNQTTELCRNELANLERGLQFITHNPAADTELCFVGATKRGQAVLVNRTIFDADLVLPIGCARIGRDNAYDSVFPRFSDAETIAKYRSPAEHDALAERKGKRTLAEESGWMISAPMTVQVVPGPNETVAHVLAGEPHAVARSCDELCCQQWLYKTPQRVSLLVATITGGAASQTWANVGRALETAEHVLEEGGAIAICTNLDEPPGQSLGRLIGDTDLDSAARKISHDHDADSWPAWRLARALQRGPVYFMSQLDAETVEDLGLAPVESIDDLARLAGRHESFTIVEDAQHAVVRVTGEGDAVANDHDNE
jgi:nickel-dependent lactate racemase